MLSNIDTSKLPTLSDYIDIGKDNSYNLNNIICKEEYGEFKIPSYSIFRDRYRHIIENDCITITLTENEEKRYRFKPKTLSYDLYGTTELWHLLLWINNITSVTNFKPKDSIRVFNRGKLIRLERILEKELNNNE